jgi:hypothetical protein
MKTTFRPETLGRALTVLYNNRVGGGDTLMTSRRKIYSFEH